MTSRLVAQVMQLVAESDTSIEQERFIETLHTPFCAILPILTNY